MIFGVGFLCMSVGFAMPFVVTTVFDLRSRRILHYVDAAWGWYKRRCSYAFTEVADVGIKEYGGDGVTYMPVIVTADGRIIQFSLDNGSTDSRCANAIEAISAATGLHKLDLPRQRWWQLW
jgi:hypothetical protein